MPAVNPTQLKFQLDALMGYFYEPEDFHRELSDLFSRYANLALRFGDEAPTQPFMEIYHLPFPVIRQLRLDLRREINRNPQVALLLADELWQDAYLEVKETAIYILGQTPTDDPKLILERINLWLDEDIEKALKTEILSAGTHLLQTHFPKDWEDFIKSFLVKDQIKNINLGLQGLTEGLKNPEFTNIPIVFRLVSDFIQEPQAEYRGALINLIEALADRLPVETAYFLRQALSISQSSELPRLIKNCLEFFPEDVRENLSSSVRR